MSQMKSIVINELVNVHLDISAPIVSLNFIQSPQSSKEILSICNSFADVIDQIPKPGGICYSVCDCSRQQPFTFDLLISFFISALPKLRSKGLVFSAFVGPRNFQNVIAMDSFLAKTDSQPIACFEEFEQAYKFVKSEWYMITKSVIAE